AGKHTGNQPARLAHHDDGNDRAILVQGDEGSAQVVRLGHHRATPSIRCSDEVYTIRLPANRVLQEKIGHLLKRPVGRPPQEVRRYYASFSYRAQSWKKPRRVVAKVEWHPGELYPRVGFIVTNLARPAERVRLVT